MGETEIETELRRRRRGAFSPVAAGQATREFLTGTVPEFFTATGRFEPSEEVAELPEIGDADFGSAGTNLQIAAGLLVTADPQAQIDIIRDAVPEAIIRTNDQNETIVTFGDESFVLNKPGFSFQDGIQAISQVLQFIPAFRIAGLARTTLGRVGLAGITEGATSVGQDVAAGALGSEQGISATRAGISALLGSGFRAGGEIFRLLRARRKITKEGEQAIEEAAEQAGEATGIQLTAAQRLGTPQALEMQTILNTLPGSAQKALKTLGRQNEQVQRAVDDFIVSVGQRDALETGAIRFRTAAQESIEAQKQIRRQETSILFENSFDVHRAAGVPIDTSPLIQGINQTLGNFPASGQVAGTLNRVIKLIDGAKGDLRLLQGAKKEIDLLLEKRGSAALGGTTKRELGIIQRNLIGLMETASPEFAAARQEFIRLSPAVNQLENGIIGRTAKINDDMLRQVSTRIFSGAEMNPEVLRNVRRVIDQVDPGAFDDLLQIEMTRRIGKIRLPDDPSVTINVPKLLNDALFGNTNQRRILFDSLSGERLANAKFLNDMLERASKGRFTGSPTAMRTQIIESQLGRRGAAGTVVGTLRDIIGLNREAILRGTADQIVENNARRMADIIFDTSFEGGLTRIRKLFVRGEEAQASTLLSELFSAVGRFVSRETLTPQQAVQ